MNKTVFALLVMIVFIVTCLSFAEGTTEILSWDSWKYQLREDGTIEIEEYIGEEEQVEIPAEIDGKAVTALGRFGWNKCKEIIIPDSIIAIEQNPFTSCNYLTNIILSEKSPFVFHDGSLFEKANNRLISYLEGFEEKEYSVPEGTLIIGKSAFSSNNYLRRVILPESVVEIQDSAFCDCLELRELSIPSEVSVIEDFTFHGCESLKDITIPSGVISIGKDAFWYCSSLKSITLPESLKTIGEDAFSCCRQLSTISIPNSVTDIVGNPFTGCDNLKTIHVLPDHSVLAVIDNVLFSKTEKKLICYPYALTNKKYEIPKGIKIIGEEAFSSCYDLKEITIPDTVIVIENRAFESMGKLKSIIIPASVQSVGNSAFSSCGWLEDVVIQEGVSSIGYNAFSRCSCLKTISVPSSVIDIGSGAFDNCEKLTVSITEGSYAEKYCKENRVNYTYPGVNDWLNN